MDVKIPLDAKKGTYEIKATASGNNGKSSSSFYFYIDVLGPDLYIDKLWTSHNPVLNGETITIYAKIANKGSEETEKFGIEISILTPEGSWDVVGTKNISGLKHGKTQTISMKYTFDETGIYNIKAYVDYSGKIDEEDNANNIVTLKNLEVVKVESEGTSFFTHIILIIGSVSAVTVLSLYSKKKRK